MEPPSEEKRRNHVIIIDPDEPVLTAYPYRPHSSLLDFLKGEPKLLGAIQIILSLVIVGLGVIVALNFIFSSKKVPLAILSGYPFWGAVIFFLTGFVTMSHDKPRHILKQDIMIMNIFSSLTALAGIALTLFSFTQHHKFCQAVYLEGPCVVGKTLLLGLLSVLLIITIVELSISVTILSLRSRCWTSPREAVFFFPSEGPQNTEHLAPEENNTLQFEFQEKSSKDKTVPSIKSVFLGGYAFFKLRVSRNPSAPRTIPEKSDKGTSSMHVTPVGQEAIPPLSSETKLNALPPSLIPHSSENTPQKDSRTDQLIDEDLSSIVRQTSDMQSNVLDYENASVKGLKTPSSHNFLNFLPDNLSSQSLMASLSTQVLQSKQPSLHVSESYDMISEDFLSENMPFQDNQSQDIPSQYTPSQDILAQDIASQETSYREPSYQGILTKDTSPQETPYQYILTKEIPFQETPLQGNLLQGTPSEGTPSKGTPSQGTLSQGTPPKGTPSQGTPSQGTLPKGTPSKGTPSEGTLPQGSPSEGTPSHGTPSQGTLSQGTPPQGTPSQGTPPYGTPSQGTLSKGTPSQGTLSKGTPSQGTLSKGTPSQGTLPQGSPSEGTPSQGTLSQGPPPQGTPFKEISFQYIITKDTSSQETPYQETPFQDTLTQNIPSQDIQSEEILSQEISSQDTPFQITVSQNIQYQDILSQDKISQNSQTQNIVPQDMSSSDLQIQNPEVQIQQHPEIFYRDIRTEVMEMTQEWTSNQDKKPTRRLSLSLPGMRGQFQLKRHSVDLQVKTEKPRRYSEDLQSKSTRRKSIDQQIKAWISPKKTTIETKDAYTQTQEQAEDQQALNRQAEDQQAVNRQAEDQQVKEEEVPVQSQTEQIKHQKSEEELLSEEDLNDKENEDQQSDTKQPPQEQAQVQPAEDQHPKEEKASKTQLQNWQGGQQVLVKRSPMQLSDNWDSQSYQCTESSCSFWSTPSWQPISQRSQDWISQGWRNKDWKAQEWQFEVQPSLDWESQELLERESLRQRALYQQMQPRTTIVQQTPDQRQLRNFVFQVGVFQSPRQQDSESGVLIEDADEDDAQSRDREPGDTEDTCQKPTDQQSEDVRPDNYPVSCQSLVPYTNVTCLSNIASEQEVQNNTPCSGSSKDLNATSSSSYQRDQQQSEDSD